jgi:WD40 repeat protein
VVYSDDGQWIATATSDGIVGLWDAESGEQIAALEGHESGVRSVAFSPDGTLLASGGDAGDVCLWAVETLELVLCQDQHTFRVIDVMFQGTTVISASADGTIESLEFLAN